MNPSPLRVVLDANVLFPFSLRDTLLRAAAAGYYQVYWSERILEETTRSLVRTSTVTEEQAAYLRNMMTRAFPEAMVKGYEPLIDAMENDPKDRHVAAVAVKAKAQVIVTNNRKDFRRLPQGVRAQQPDDFLTELLDAKSLDIIDLLRRQAEALQNPPKTFAELLNGLEKTVPQFITSVREIVETQS